MVKSKRQIKSLKACLKDIEIMLKTTDDHGRPWVVSGNNVPGGNNNVPIEGGDEFNLRYRETIGNWFLCAILCHIDGSEWVFGDDQDGDGVIINSSNGQRFSTEHVMAIDYHGNYTSSSGDQKIVNAINHKIARGESYTKGKHLVVFAEGLGERHPNKVSKIIENKNSFDAIYCVGITDRTNWVYGLTKLEAPSSPIYLIHFNTDFTDWEVKRMQ